MEAIKVDCPYCGHLSTIRKNTQKGIFYTKKCKHCKEDFKYHIPITIEKVVRKHGYDVSPETGLVTDGYAGVM